MGVSRLLGHVVGEGLNAASAAARAPGATKNLAAQTASTARSMDWTGMSTLRGDIAAAPRGASIGGAIGAGVGAVGGLLGPGAAFGPAVAAAMGMGGAQFGAVVGAKAGRMVSNVLTAAGRKGMDFLGRQADEFGEGLGKATGLHDWIDEAFAGPAFKLSGKEVGNVGTSVGSRGAKAKAKPTSNESVNTQNQFTPLGEMSGASMFGAALGLGALGGAASYATGGEFGQGFVAGAAGGFGMRGLQRAAQNNLVGGQLKMTKKFSQEGASKTAASVLNSGANSLATMNSRTAMMAGAGLTGAIFGGDRNSHQRGFNQNRGSRF